MRRLILALILLVASVVQVAAQGPVVIGPNSRLLWDVAATAPAVAQGYTYNLAVDQNPPFVLAGVTCVAGPAGGATCSVPAMVAPLGTHTLVMTTTSGGSTSLPSSQYIYTTILVPVPSNIRIQ